MLSRALCTAERSAMAMCRNAVRRKSTGSAALAQSLPSALLQREPLVSSKAAAAGQSRRQSSASLDAESVSISKQIDHGSQLLEMLGMEYPVFVVTKKESISCMRVKNLLRDFGVRFRDVQIDGLTEDEQGAMRAVMQASTGEGSVPRVYVGGKCLGGYQELQRQLWSGELARAHGLNYTPGASPNLAAPNLCV